MQVCWVKCKNKNSTFGKCSKILNTSFLKKKAERNSADPDQTASLIRVFPVYYSEKHFVKTNILFENRKSKVFEILEYLSYSFHCIDTFRVPWKMFQLSASHLVYSFLWTSASVNEWDYKYDQFCVYMFNLCYLRDCVVS